MMGMLPDDSSRPLLSIRQKRLVGFAIALFALLGSVWMLVKVIGAAAALFGKFYSVLWPLAAAGILATILQPAVHGLETRGRMRRLWAVLILYAAFVLLLAGLLVLVTPSVVEQALGFVAYVPQFWENVLHYVQNHYPDWFALAERHMANPQVKAVVENLFDELRHFLQGILPSFKAAKAGLMNVFGFLTNVATVPIYLFFFLISGRMDPTRRLGEHLPFLDEDKRADVIFLAREFITIVVAFFRGQLLIGLIMGALLAIGFSLVGLKFGLLLGLLLGILNIIPYLGTIIGIGLTLPLAFLQPGGGWELVAWTGAVFVLVQCIEGWVLTPKIMGAQTGLHPVAIIFSIFFWGTALNGVLGMLLAVPLSAFFVTAWRLVRRKYFTKNTDAEGPELSAEGL